MVKLIHSFLNNNIDSSGDINYLFLGNPGAGKSTLLNCLMVNKNPNLNDDQKFKSGVSILKGQYKFESPIICREEYLQRF